MKNKVLLLSIDSLSTSDYEHFKTLKNAKRIMKNGVYTDKLYSVYPTQTYTIHTSVVTGNYPDKHGIYNNHEFQPFVDDQTFFWYQHQIKSPTIYDIAKKNKLKCASLLWPVSGKASIKYNMPEISTVGNENQVLKVLKNGSPLFIISLEAKFAKMRTSYSQPYLDEYLKLCAIDTIKTKKPDLMMLHIVSLDWAKHTYSTNHPIVTQTLENIDKNIGEIIDATDGEYSIILFGDHGQFTINKNIYINNLLRDADLLDEKEKTYRAYIQGMGGSAILHIKDNDINAQEIALDILNKNKDILGIEEIYDRDTLDKLHFGKGFNYVIEGKVGYNYKETLNKKLVEDLADSSKLYATHGYNPNKDNYSCVFMAMGKDIKQNEDIGKINMVDIAPTIGKLLGTGFYECDGEIIEKIFT